MAEMDGQIVLITGATNGIGEATAHALAEQGATVVLVARNESKAQRVQSDIKSKTNNQNVDYIIADLSVMDEVRKAAQTFKNRYDALHVLVNNAGAIFTEYEETADGYEYTFALNHLNYFLLTHELLDLLKATGTPDHHARVVNVSSSAHFGGTMDWDDVQNQKGYGTGIKAYSRSKLCNVMFTYELDRRLREEGANVSTNALHPGVVRTGFGHNNGLMTRAFVGLIQMFSLNAQQGAATQIYLASSPEVEGVSGKYFEKKKPKRSSSFSREPAYWAHLWAISEELTGLKSGETA